MSFLAGQTGYGQAPAPPPPTFPFCATPDLSREQALDLIRQARQAYQQKIASGGAFQTITYVPIRPHILRRSDGSGAMSLNLMNQVIALTNKYYLLNGAGIQFFFSGTSPDYVDNDQFYNSYRNQDENAVASGRDATNAMNQYYVNSFASGAGGYAYYPDNALYSTRSFILNEYNAEDMGNRLIPHELGHNFNLVHTFGQRPGNGTLGSGTTLELVTRGSGANCLFEGDYICDTPADPYNAPGAYLTYQNGCPIYDPTSTARDANGDAYAPSITNIMSYYYPCTHEFTPGQYERMQQGLALRQSHTAYTLNAPPTNANAPSNLAGNFSNGAINLTWQDNATNEMGYFIERSTSPDAGFLPIGGVGPNETLFTDTKVSANTTYYYRVHPSNTTTGGFSPTVTVQIVVPLLTGLRTTNISANEATLNWDYLGNYTYDVQWRPVGSATWNTATAYSTSYRLDGLTLNVAYEWRVKVTGGSTYAGPVSFTTSTCPVPIPSTPYPGPTSASLGWDYGNSSRQYTVQFRRQNTTAWTTVEGITSPYYSLTGLATQTPYEWRVRATCGGSSAIVTDYSPVQSFTTLACPVPTLSLNSYNSSAVLVNWGSSVYGLNTTYTLRYRPVGATNWTRIEGLTTTTYSVTGLTANTSYEIQVATNCSTQEQSAFSASLIVIPACQSASYLRYVANATSAQLIWNTPYTPEPGTTFGLQYRPAGSTAWSSVISVPAMSSGITYALTGLATSTTYEWRVQTNCPTGAQADYVVGPNFTTDCFPPYSLFSTEVSTTSAKLSWYATVEPDARFDVRYRVAGTVNWITQSNLNLTDTTNYTYTLTGLTNNTTYEWQVRTVCSPTTNSAFVTGQNFTTNCQRPYDAYTGSIAVTSAQLNWLPTGVPQYEVRYRQTGTINYSNVGNTTTAYLSLSGLLTNTSYEWQVRSQCDGNLLSDFSSVQSFTTYACLPPSDYNRNTYVQGGTSAKLTWDYYNGNSDTRYEIRYRLVGAPGWVVVGNLSTAPRPSTLGSYTLTSLTPNMQYEWQIRTVCSATESSAFSSSVQFSTCNQLYTLRDGSWYDSSIWSCGRVPTNTDTVEIRHRITVGDYPALVGKLTYATGGQLLVQVVNKLYLGR